MEVWKIIFQYNGMKSNLRHQWVVNATCITWNPSYNKCIVNVYNNRFLSKRKTVYKYSKLYNCDSRPRLIIHLYSIWQKKFNDNRVSLVDQLVKNPSTMRETPGSDPWVGKILCRRERPPTPVFWSGEFMDYTVHGVAKSRTRLSDFYSTSLHLMIIGLPFLELCPAITEDFSIHSGYCQLERSVLVIYAKILRRFIHE